MAGLPLEPKPRAPDHNSVGAEAKLRIVRDRTAGCREMVTNAERSSSLTVYAVLGEYLRDMEAIVGPTRDLEKELLTLQAQNEQLKNDVAFAENELTNLRGNVRKLVDKWSTP